MTWDAFLVCGRIQGVVKDNCTLKVGEWEIKGVPQAVRSEQGTRSGHPVCVPVPSPVQLPLHPFEKVGFGRVVNEKSGVVCSEKHDSRGLTVSLGINLMRESQLRKHARESTSHSFPVRCFTCRIRSRAIPKLKVLDPFEYSKYII
jgi:hypothetical protein